MSKPWNLRLVDGGRACRRSGVRDGRSARGREWLPSLATLALGCVVPGNGIRMQRAANMLRNGF